MSECRSHDDGLAVGHDAHVGIHGGQAGLPGEHPGRARNPVIKVRIWHGSSSRSRICMELNASRTRSGSSRQRRRLASCSCGEQSGLRRA